MHLKFRAVQPTEASSLLPSIYLPCPPLSPSGDFTLTLVLSLILPIIDGSERVWGGFDKDSHGGDQGRGVRDVRLCYRGAFGNITEG